MENLLAPRQSRHIGRDPKSQCPTVRVEDTHERHPVFVSCVKLRHALAALDPTDAEAHLA